MKEILVIVKSNKIVTDVVAATVAIELTVIFVDVVSEVVEA